MSTNFWKYLSIGFMLLCGILVYILFQNRGYSLRSNQMSLNNLEDLTTENSQSKDPQNSQDLNDYFFKNQTKIKFTSDLYDYDTIKQGVNITREIKYVNEGENPFFITDIKVSCGCTIPTYEKEPVKPKDTGVISVEFRTTGKEGFVMNKMTLKGNVENGEISTYFKAYVKTK